MKKLLVLGIVAVMMMGATAAMAVVDTDWLVYMQAGNATFSTTTQNWGNAGTEIKFGAAAAPGTVNGAAFVSTSATVRDMSAIGGGYGLTTNTVAGFDTGTVVWDNIRLFAGGGYSNAALWLRIWGVGLDANTPKIIKLEVTQAAAGTGFTVGQVVFDTSKDALLTNATKKTPSIAIDLSQYIAALKLGTADAPAVTFKLTASNVPEPGSMVALLSGLVGLVGFGIRRRK